MDSNRVFVREATGLTRKIGGRSTFVGNVMCMGIAYGAVFAFFAGALYPGVNLPLTVVVTLLPAFLYSIIYYIFTLSMPRTGGDYVWVSRIVHPAVGFVENWMFTIGLPLMTAGVVAGWVVLYGLAPMFTGLGIVYAGSNFTNLATSITQMPLAFVVSLVLLVAFLLPLFFSTEAVFKFLTIMFGLAIVCTFVMIFAFFSAPNPTFISNFNSLSGMNYAKTISAAGLPPGFTLSATLTGSVFTITNFFGFTWSAYYSGEVKDVKKSQLIGIFGSVLLMALVMGLFFASAYYSVGSDFINAASNLAASGSSSYTLPAAPVLNLLVAFATPNPIVIVLSSLALIATSLASITAFSFVCVRNVFSWSFDRIVPSWFANLDSKRGSPYVAVLLIMILEVATVVGYYFTSLFTYYIYSSLMGFICFAIASLAAIYFPMRRKDIFDSSPDIVKKKIGNLPLISILGIAGFVLSAALAYASISPAVTPPPAGPPIVQFLSYAIDLVIIFSGLGIYAVAHYYRKSQGLPLETAFGVIPPL